MVDPLGAPRAVTVPAPAKINLYLHVTGRRADGLHLLDSLVAFAGVGDTVAVAPAPDLRVSVHGPLAGQVPAGPENLALRAARGLAGAFDVRAGAAITLTKRLPAAAGIGGGSADAAATLRALAALWRVGSDDGADDGADDRALAALAVQLGADVPVCLAGRASFVGGIGEVLMPAPALPPAWLVLANPGATLATGAVFAARSGAFSEPARFAHPPRDAGALAQLLGSRHNDLVKPASRLAPVIGEVLAALVAEPGALLARMSGSGATCFGLFDAARPAKAAAARLSAAHPGWWVAPAPLVDDVARLSEWS